MKFSLLALAIGVSAQTQTPIPVCYGLDPKRNADDTLNQFMGLQPNVDACIKKCEGFAYGCKVVNWSDTNGQCWGYNKYSGSCSLDNEWKTYYTASNSVYPAPICRGLDPARNQDDSLNVHLGTFSTLHQCLFACETKDNCEVVNYDNTGSCWGYNSYSGQCQANGTWNTYALKNSKWGAYADMIHIVYKGACFQVKGKDLLEHAVQERVNGWAKTHHTKMSDGPCGKK